jgi:hypothetical protein
MKTTLGAFLVAVCSALAGLPACDGKPPQPAQSPTPQNDADDRSSQITKRCGRNPLLSFTRQLISDLNETVDFKENIKKSVESCANGDVDASFLGQSVAKASLKACISRKVELDEKAKGTLLKLVDDAYAKAESSSAKTLAAWDECGADMIKCGTHPCPSCGNARVDDGEKCDEGSDNGAVGHCKKNCLGFCGREGDECCAADSCRSGAVCASAKCVACGGDGQPWCSGGACNAPFACWSGTCSKPPPPPPPPPTKTAARCKGNHIELPDGQPYRVTITAADFDGGGRALTQLFSTQGFVDNLPLNGNTTRTFQGPMELRVGSRDSDGSPWGEWPSCSPNGSGKLRISIGAGVKGAGHADFAID